MKKILITFLFITLFTSANAQLKLDDWGYHRYDNAVELKMTPFINLSLPANMGFRLPALENAFVEIDGQIIFKLNPKYLKDGGAANFQFELNHGDPTLYLKIMVFPEAVKEFLLEDQLENIGDFLQSQLGKDETVIESQQSALGKSFSILVNQGSSPFEMHQFFYQGYWYMFIFETKVNETQRKTYEDVIRSVKSIK